MKRMRKILCLIGTILMLLGAGNAVWAAEIVKSGNLEYRTQIQNLGWQDWKGEDEQSGTSGKGLRLEGIEIKVTNLPDSAHQLGISYQTHVQNIGWQNWVLDGVTSGTVGQGLRLEAIRIKLTGVDANKYDIYYRVHAQNFGWMGWAKNGEDAGTAGYGYRLEAIQIQMKQKSESPPADVNGAAFKKYVPGTGSASTGSNLGGERGVDYSTIYNPDEAADYGTGISN